MNYPSIYLGNLPYTATKEDVQGFLEGGAPIAVKSIRLATFPDGRPRGFGFASLGSDAEVATAIEMLDGTELLGRRIVVSVARERMRDGGGGGGRPAPKRHEEPRGEDRGKRSKRDKRNHDDFWRS